MSLHRRWLHPSRGINDLGSCRCGRPIKGRKNFAVYKMATTTFRIATAIYSDVASMHILTLLISASTPFTFHSNSHIRIRQSLLRHNRSSLSICLLSLFSSKSKIKSLQVRIREFKKMKSPKSGLEDARTADRQFQADKEWNSLRDSTHATHRPLRKVGGVGETDEGDKESKSSSANSTAEGSLSSGTPDAANVFKYARPLSPVPEDSVEETLALVRSRLMATAEARGERNKGEAEGNSEAISDSGAARPVNTIRGRDVVDFRIPSMSSSWLEHKRVERLLKVVELENLLQAQAIRTYACSPEFTL